MLVRRYQIDMQSLSFLQFRREKAFLDLNYMFYNLPLKIQKIEGAL